MLTQDNSIVTELQVLYTGRNYRKPSCKIYDFITDRSGNFLTKQALQKDTENYHNTVSRLSEAVYSRNVLHISLHTVRLRQVRPVHLPQ